MQIIIPAFLIILAGGIGGSVNAFLTENGFVFPRKIKDKNITIVKPGYIGNIFVGAVSSLVSWGLYGPIAGHDFLNLPKEADIPLNLSSLAGAILVGISGAKWLTSEVDKNLFKAAAVEAAKKPPNINASQRISNTNSPEMALEIAQGID